MNTVLYAFASFIATCGGIGYAPYAPGTCASVLALLFWYLFFSINNLCTLMILMLLIIVGIMCSDFVAKYDRCKDPSYIVIDEWVGMGIALLFVPTNWPYYFLACVLFRLFDITKIFFINRVEKLPGGWGIMLDDILAGFYTFLIMRLICCFL